MDNHPQSSIAKKTKKPKVVDTKWRKGIDGYVVQSKILTAIKLQISSSKKSDNPSSSDQHNEQSSTSSSSQATPAVLSNVSPSTKKGPMSKEERAIKNQASAKKSHRRRKDYDMLVHKALVDLERRLEVCLVNEEKYAREISKLRQEKQNLTEQVQKQQQQIQILRSNTNLPQSQNQLYSTSYLQNYHNQQQTIPFCNRPTVIDNKIVGSAFEKDTPSNNHLNNYNTTQKVSPDSIIPHSEQLEEKASKGMPQLVLKGCSSEDDETLQEDYQATNSSNTPPNPNYSPLAEADGRNDLNGLGASSSSYYQPVGNLWDTCPDL